MSMTREEANEILSDWALCHYTPSKEAAEAVISALDPLDIITALRSPTREMVERMFPGCPGCDSVTSKWEIKFCPFCGKPRTDEAVDILWQRWKEAVDGETD